MLGTDKEIEMNETKQWIRFNGKKMLLTMDFMIKNNFDIFTKDPRVEWLPHKNKKRKRLEKQLA